MQIVVNGEPRNVAADTTVASLLRELRLESVGVAVELNRDVIPRQRHPAVVLREGDKLEVVTLVGGG